jgi:WD repeat-containing protein 55
VWKVEGFPYSLYTCVKYYIEFRRMSAFDIQTAPDDIECSEQVFDVDFHPTRNFLAAGLIDGEVDIFQYGLQDSNKLMAKLNHHTSSCRGVSFSPSGDALYSISSDMSLVAVDSVGTAVLNIPNAHLSPINKMVVCEENIVATGDDKGCVKLWDMRIRNATNCVKTWEMHEDFVSGMCYSAHNSTLLSVSGDCTLCAYDIRNHKNCTRSDEQECELTCVDVIKNGRKVVCGTQDGTMLIFSAGLWGDCSDRVPDSHPETVESMTKLDERTLITGCSDGIIRVMQIHPNKVSCVVGDHDGFPVEGIKRHGGLLCTYSLDEILHFWDVSVLVSQSGEDPGMEEEDTDMDTAVDGNMPSASARRARRIAEEEEEDSDEDEDSDDEEDDDDAMEDEDDSDEDEDDSPAAKLPTASEKFYADL